MASVILNDLQGCWTLKTSLQCVKNATPHCIKKKFKKMSLMGALFESSRYLYMNTSFSKCHNML